MQICTGPHFGTLSPARYDPLVILLLLSSGCLERVTGEAKPLPEAFTKGGDEEASSGPVHLDMEHGSGDVGSQLFGEIEGDFVTVTGVIVTEHDLPVDIDVLAPDPGEDSGFGQLGKLMLEGPGEFSFDAPEDFGGITLQAFQDLQGDGPDDDDPFGVVTVVVTDTAPDPIELPLVVGGRELANLAAGAAPSIFGDHDGEWTTVAGTITGEPDIGVDFDVRVVAEDAGPSGDAYLGKIQFPGPGEYSTLVPRDYGTLRVQVFQDAKKDGPTPDDPFAAIEIVVGDVDLVEQDVALTVGGYSATTQPTGGPSGEGPGPAGGIAQALFPDLSDPVTISGTLTAEGLEDAVIDVDVFAVDAEGHGGRRYLGKVKAAAGAWSFQAPRGFGQLYLEAIVDRDGDGPTPGDPKGVYADNPLDVGKVDVSGMDISVVAGG